MSTPGSTLFRDMDPSFLAYWKDVRTLAFAEVPDYGALKSHFVQCWERKGFDNSPGEYDWLALFKRLNEGTEDKGSAAPLDNPIKIPPISGAVAAGPITNPSHSVH